MEYIKEDIEKMLIEHKENEAKLTEIDLKMEDIENAAKVLNVPLFEKVAFPHYTMDKNNVIVSKEAVPVG